MEKIPDDWEERVAWLKGQAAQAYRFNAELDYWEVRERFYYEGDPPFIPTPPTERLKDAFQFVAAWGERDPSLLHRNPDGPQVHRTIRQFLGLSEGVQTRISDFFSDHGLHDFDYFDHGGWGVVFKAQDRETGRNRIARIGCDTTENRWRPDHCAVLPLLASNYDDLPAYEDLKLEIMPEIVPLHKLPARPNIKDNENLLSEFLISARTISAGTNILYPDIWLDEDSDPGNVGLLPDGKVVAFDPLFVRGDLAIKRRESFVEFTGEHKAVADKLYGMAPDARFF